MPPLLIVNLRAQVNRHLQRLLEAVGVVVEGLVLAATLALLPAVAVGVGGFIFAHLVEGGGEGVEGCGIVCVWGIVFTRG